MLSRDCLLQCRARALSLGHHYVNCPQSNEESKSCSCYFSELAPGHFNRHQAQRRIHHFPSVLRHLTEELLLLFGSMKEMSPFKSVCPREFNRWSVKLYTATAVWAKPPNHTLSWSVQGTMVFHRIHRGGCYAYNRGHELAVVLGALVESS